MKWSKAPAKEQAKFKRLYGTKVKAGQQEYKIVWCHDILSDEGNPCYGMCSYKDRKIYIDIKYDEIQETLVHEIFHAEVYESGFKQMSAFHSDLEELCCEAASRVARNFKLRRR